MSVVFDLSVVFEVGEGEKKKRNRETLSNSQEKNLCDQFWMERMSSSVLLYRIRSLPVHPPFGRWCPNLHLTHGSLPSDSVVWG